MKINNLKINAYGNIENKDINLKQGINIIQGKNESGKSTLLNYIISSFYGISKNKDGRVLSDYDRYKPWNNSEFSGRIDYELDDGNKYEIFRDFNKKNPKIYNDKLEDITNKFEVDKKDGSKFFFEQTGVDKQMYLSTVVSPQEEVRLKDKDQNILIQKIANLAGTGEDNVSYKKAIEKMQEKIRDEIGTNKTTQKPINIVEKEIKEIEDKIKSISQYQDRKYEIDNEKEKIEGTLETLELEKRILMELQEATNKNDIQNKEIEIKEKNKAENLLKIKQLKEEEKLLDNENKEIKQSITNRKELIEKNKSKKEEINSQIEKIKNENVNDSIYKKNNKSKIFLAIFVTLIILCIIITITVKNYVFSGVIGAIALLDIALYANTIKKDIEYKKATHEAIDIELNKLIDEKKKTETLINEKEQELKEYEQNEKEITNKTSMIEGQIILLEKSNEQINVELNTINREQKDKDYSRKDEIITKYKDEFPGIEDLVNKGDYRTRDVDEKINNLKIMIKGLEIESSTIIPQLDEMVTLEEKLELNNTKLKELKKEEETINIAISTLTEAYEEMKNTITPKFTLNLSSSIKQISNNKYEKVTINDDNGMIVENNRGEYVDAAKLSTGTIDQLYLALRLSMIDDLSKEKLPIILDESFAYFDNSRLENILKYLNGELNNHQTIILTCTNREKDILDKINVEYNLVEL
ncbi:MAG: ATP-binding protein [Clostridia bacterium]